MIYDLYEKIGIEKEDAEFLTQTYNSLIEKKDICEDLYTAMDSFFCTDTYDFVDILKGVAGKSGVEEYTVEFIFMLMAIRPMHYIYKRSGISDDIFYETIKDFGYKLNECKKLHNIRGTFVIYWYKHFVDQCIVALGRLQYEKRAIKYDYKDLAKEGDIVLSCHIPSSGSLLEEDIVDSLKKAYEFYGFDGKMIVTCDTWLLYPPHYQLFREGSNLRKFYDLFDVIGENENENVDLWRIFNKENGVDIAELPQDTHLQREFVKFLKDGNKMGAGYGVIVFDGEKIITKK